MNKEIERKFIVDPRNESYLALIHDAIATIENRYYLYKAGNVELRFTSLEKSNGEFDYTLDRMHVLNDELTLRSKERIQISKSEFEEMLTLVLSNNPITKPVIRRSYDVSENPKLQLKVYGGDLDGLVRAEVEFDSLEDCHNYVPLEWMGEEISNTLIGNDITLPDLSQEEFNENLSRYLKKF